MKLLTSKTFLFLLFVILILKSVTVWSSNLDKIKEIKTQVNLDNLQFYDFNKNTLKIIDKETEFYILNFWASWCAPCIKEMKSFNNLRKKFPKIKIITLSQDSDINDAINFFHKNNYTHLQKSYDFNKDISKNFSLRGLPTTFIFNNMLKAFAKVEGIIEWDSEEFIKWLDSY